MNRRIKPAIAVFMIGLLTQAHAPAFGQVQDTPGNRMAAAYRYMHVTDFATMMDSTVRQVALNYPENVRQAFIRYMKTVDTQGLEAIMIAALSQHFTTGELTALSDFYSTPNGKSIMKKMPDVMASTMPSIEMFIVEAAKNFPQPNERGAK